MLVLLPPVRRRLLPTLAGLPAVEGHAGQTRLAGVASVAPPPPAVSEPSPATPAPPEPVVAVPAAPLVGRARRSHAPGGGRAPGPGGTPGAGRAPGGIVAVPPQPSPSRLAWAREHATQGALVATVIAGGLVRALRRGRGR